MKRIVVDTSVLIEALIGETGPARQVIRLCLLGEYQPILGNALFSEYEDVAARPEILQRCPVGVDGVRELLNAIYSVSDWIPVYFLWRPNLRDEADNHVLELAIAAQASTILTRNLKDFRGAQLQFPELVITSPDQFLKRK